MSERVAVSGTVLAAEVFGLADAPWIVLSNSLGATRAMWRPQRALLAPHFRVLSYDTRGHGDSATPPAPYSLDDLVADVIALMDNFGADRAHFLGLSLGGMTGLGLALKHPDRIDRLICCDARANAPDGFRMSWDDRIEMVGRGGMAALWPGTVERWLTAATREHDADGVERLRSAFLRTTAEGYTGCARAIQGLDYFKDLGSLRRPVLYVAGAEDVAAPPEVMRTMADATPTAAYVEIPAAAHIANVDNPKAFNTAVSVHLGIG